MKFEIVENLKEAGFEGFIPVKELRNKHRIIPSVPGVYMVVRTSEAEPSFLDTGTGGFFKDKNPNVSVAELKRNWIKNTCVVYIGKASLLQKRLKQYLDFGAGKPVGHYGGRFIWQLADAEDLLFCWKAVPENPENVETELIKEFRLQYGERPFANLRD